MNYFWRFFLYILFIRNKPRKNLLLVLSHQDYILPFSSNNFSVAFSILKLSLWILLLRWLFLLHVIRIYTHIHRRISLFLFRYILDDKDLEIGQSMPSVLCTEEKNVLYQLRVIIMLYELFLTCLQ